jgi:beta-glucosidase
VGTSLKHYAANNQEFQRFSISAEVDERTLREIYLPAFEKAVKKAKPWTVMCSYNKLNGVLLPAPHLLTDILKDEWGFEGLVVSDWGAVRDRVAALKAGLDWEMPGPQGTPRQEVSTPSAPANWTKPCWTSRCAASCASSSRPQETPKRRRVRRGRAPRTGAPDCGEGMVLLKNNGLLPLKEAISSIAVIGRAAQNAHFQGGGSSHINPTKVAVPFKELQSPGRGCRTDLRRGLSRRRFVPPGPDRRGRGLAQAADVAVLYIALPTYKESEGYDRTDLDLTDQQVALIKAVPKSSPTRSWCSTTARRWP